MYHFIEGRSDESAQSDDINLFLLGLIQDLIGRHHHAHVDDLVSITSQHDAHDILSDVVHIAFYGSEQYFRCGTLCSEGVVSLFFFDVGG